LLSAQSASEYASTDTFPVPFHFGNFNLSIFEPLRYLKTSLRLDNLGQLERGSSS
jgi:hypothetical protein